MEAVRYLNADFLDILFEGRNKQYGAYYLRKTYNRHLFKAVIIMLVLCLMVTAAIALSNYLKDHAPVQKKQVQKEVILRDINVKKRDLPPPPPPPAPKPPKLKTQVKYTPPKIVDEPVPPEEQPPDLSNLKNVVISTVTKAGLPDGINPNLTGTSGTGVTQAVPVHSETIRTFVEQMPSFPGGEKALMRYLRNHINYPDIAKENGIQGIVVVQFVVNTDGSIVMVQTAGQKKGGGLEKEAIRVVEQMPEWIPGKQNGRNVRVRFSLPIRFKLR